MPRKRVKSAAKKTAKAKKAARKPVSRAAHRQAPAAVKPGTRTKKTAEVDKLPAPAPKPVPAVTAAPRRARAAEGPPTMAPEPAPAGTVAPPLEKAPRRETNIADEMARRQREISVSEFFTRNRHLLGFDNPRKALLTTIKEGVDNAIDACEEARLPPDVLVRIAVVAGHEDRFRVVIEDNGPGIVRAQVPKIFAKLLYGSKFHRLKMARGQQGIGISAAGMYGQLTTGQPTCILSRVSGKKPAYYCELMIDTRKNEPRIVKEEQRDWDKPHGTRVEIELEAKYQRGRQSVDDYLEQTVIANPHVCIRYQAPEQDEIVWARSTGQLPAEPREIKPHPYGIELGTLMKMLHDTSARALSAFLRHDFARVSPRNASEICEAAKLDVRARPKQIARHEADNLYRAIQQTKLRKPPTDCIVPIGEELMLKGLQAGVPADFYASVTRPPAVYRGNPFLIEAGLAYGGQLPADAPCRLLRFANRVPLQYQQGACSITAAVSEINWRAYGLEQSGGSLPKGPIVIMVHLASVWVPFTSESKEAIADYPEITKEMKLALQDCGRKLGLFVGRHRRSVEAERKRQYIEKYIPHIGIALKDILALSDKQEQTIVAQLEDMLERSRKA